jgi:hypothetical protein
LAAAEAVEQEESWEEHKALCQKNGDKKMKDTISGLKKEEDHDKKMETKKSRLKSVLSFCRHFFDQGLFPNPKLPKTPSATECFRPDL